MPKVTFIEAGGTEHVIEADIGETLRDVAVQNDVPGIDGDCGGSCACATCHVYVPSAWVGKTGTVEKDSMEESLLQFADDYRENSRLACQIILSDSLDGLVLEIPVGQH